MTSRKKLNFYSKISLRVPPSNVKLWTVARDLYDQNWRGHWQKLKLSGDSLRVLSTVSSVEFEARQVEQKFQWVEHGLWPRMRLRAPRWSSSASDDSKILRLVIWAFAMWRGGGKDTQSVCGELAEGCQPKWTFEEGLNLGEKGWSCF